MEFDILQLDLVCTFFEVHRASQGIEANKRYGSFLSRILTDFGILYSAHRDVPFFGSVSSVTTPY